ncbi:MAG: alpha/beta hydrolase [Fimbriimonadaceae bacterium]|jgi:acetyl esterase/lipase|nr:alpha/beta hydrolase [Fimbriimonadaceae bacterium]
MNETIQVLRAQAYRGYPECQYDFVRPDTEERLPVIVYIHGGGWISGDRSMYRDEAVWACSQGFAAVCAGYRLAPLYPFPAAVADIQALIHHLRDNADELNILPDAIIAFGNSAGGHLACMAGLCQQDLESGAPAERANAVVSICGITDLRDPTQAHYPLAFSFLDQFMASRYEFDQERWSLASPLCHVHEKAGPFLIFHGSEDEIVPPDQATKLYTALCGVGVSAELYEMPGESHAFSMAAWLNIRQKTVDFIRTL